MAESEPLRSRSVIIRYRQFEDATRALKGETLEGALKRALGKIEGGASFRTRWAKRIWINGEHPEQRLGVCHLRVADSYVFGDLVSWEPGRHQPFLAEEMDAVEPDIDDLPPPAHKQFVDSMMFWLITENHVFILQQGSLRPERLEAYLRWFLVERTGASDGSLQIMLADRIELSGGGREQALADVKAIRIGGVADPGAAANRHAPTIEIGSRETRRVERSGGREWVNKILRDICGSDAEFRRTMEQVPEGTDLSVVLEIRFDTRKRVIDRDALARIARATRNLPDSDIAVETKSGVLKGDQIRLNHHASIAMIRSLLDRDQVLQGMIDAYSRFVRDGRIEASELEVKGDEN